MRIDAQPEYVEIYLNGETFTVPAGVFYSKIANREFEGKKLRQILQLHNEQGVPSNQIKKAYMVGR